MTLPIYEEIKQFYDASSGLWEQIWGEHMHHGYYGKSGRYKIERRQAQILLMQELLAWSGVTSAQNIVDVGCGIGGSTLYLAKQFQAEATGITLSPVQCERAKERAKAANLSEQVTFQVANALEMPFPDASFDLVWSLESGEHMPDKGKFLQNCYRVLQPGGRFILATWCHRPTEMLPLSEAEKRHLEEIYRVYHLPYVISLSGYRAIAQNCGFQNLRVDDWSSAVAPFWDIVIESALNPQAWVQLFQSGWDTIQGALSLGLMSQGYQKGLVQFGVLTATKPH
ncbi:methyltransferase domain-containing protein [Spirulina sp. CS-785/01]|uniref:methyltransferase domain-containing protein n=1 Tax=Spirulina sp. CS-785/01 TaxID=3021716 RepID=UPI00232E9E79|nr:methyltransferase domain-containing protein [Spirulina sp. CS-785/01]MDB9315936.1 methyltransferase domain-containing protein [Spirulina sp. CS-785/01]